jgi:hypothetical protein
MRPYTNQSRRKRRIGAKYPAIERSLTTSPGLVGNGAFLGRWRDLSQRSEPSVGFYPAAGLRPIMASDEINESALAIDQATVRVTVPTAKPQPEAH